ncbi:MAG: TRAP transporter permease [Rhodospirillaceae bacterium]|jgi:TRAP transporter 4TM/12TM fusion protein|nr:TRAP transporter permease [Rhodospirillaceae bacterium]MBT4220015.1 TRAP transporter permease [Rhodospirillaceae bacterium]MBT4463590.1 TRAP transporter permease [Rhodospirillaceae bacterium]MBT5013908.1 TRAP transporter permease [Rhodospirillaceae bacterium]MBT7356729.1 TRAP transporter permease [Rhodospirillaceae bacterium]
MSDEQAAAQDIDEQKLQDMVAETDTGARSPSGLPKQILWVVPLIWSVYQVYVSSPLVLEFTPWMNEDVVKRFHLMFSIFLAFLAYPAFKRSPRSYIPTIDWVLAAVAVLSILYLVVLKDELAQRPGAPTSMDVYTSVIGVVLLLEATRRALGPPLMIVAMVFLVYTFAGPHMPDVIAHKGASLNKGASHYWLSTEGVFGVAIGVSATMVYLFVLFGALLEKAGAGNYLIRVAFALMGHMSGGPAKAAVVSSAMTGMISGSSIANVVTTGTFTIPLMKRVGFSAEKAGAVEVASSTNGQLTPPIMGAAAFLMVEYVGIPLVDVIKHAFLPAVISYIALVYIVHLEAQKAGMKGLPRIHKMGAKGKMIGFLSIAILSGFLVYALPPLMELIKSMAGDATGWVVAVLLFGAYVVLLWYASLFPDLETSHEINELPEIGPTVKVGLHYILPVVVLIWLLTVERLSPGTSAFWATVFMGFVVITQKPLIALFRGQGGKEAEKIREGLSDLVDGMISGGRNMIGIGVATATAGVIVGTVTLTGIGQVMTEFVEFISAGSLILMLLFTAVISLILGMGLPTTANYIVVSSLMAPVIVTLGAENGLIIPLIAAHMFVFYFGILADDTPPVGLAAFAAAAISGGDPIRTGIQGFAYDIRTAILPFLFIFNTQLLMIGVEDWIDLTLTISSAVIAMLVFAAGTQGFFIVRSKLWETAALLLVAFTLFRPGYWMDMVYPPLQAVSATNIYEIAGNMTDGSQIRIEVKGESLEGKEVQKIIMLPMGSVATGEERLASAGLELRNDDGRMIIDNIVFGSVAEKQKLDFDWEILSVYSKTERPPKQLWFIPAVVLLGGIIMMQRRRRSAAKMA